VDRLVGGFIIATRKKIKNRHPHRDAVGDLIEDD
jgi:hypothetical protein